MNNRNCINCGAPTDSESSKCAYCGTSYFDFTDIDLGSPVILRIKDNDKIFLMKVLCTQLQVNLEPEIASIGYIGSLLNRSIVTNITREITLSFTEVN